MTTALRSALCCAVLASGLLSVGRPSAAQEAAPPSPVSLPAPAAFSPPADGTPLRPVAATHAYLATVAGESRARSDAYFEGGYWLQLWDFLFGVAVNLALLASGLSRAHARPGGAAHPLPAAPDRAATGSSTSSLTRWCSFP